MTVVAKFEIHHTRYIDPDGKPVQELPPFARDPQALVGLYRWMVLMRAVRRQGDRAAAHRSARHLRSLLGKEAVEAGLPAMKPDDVFLMTYRENGAQLMRGVTLRMLFLYWGGDERGWISPDRGAISRSASRLRHMSRMRPASPMRSSCAGVARRRVRARRRRDVQGRLLRRNQRRRHVAAAARLRRFNNQWAISVPRSAQTAAATLAQKAIAAGFGASRSTATTRRRAPRPGPALAKARAAAVRR